MGKLVKFEEPKHLKHNEMKAGYVFETEYGDYGNFVTIVFEKAVVEKDKWLHTWGTYLCTGREFEGYSNAYYDGTYKVIGKVVNE